MNAGLGHLPRRRKRVRSYLAGKLAALALLCTASLAEAAVEAPLAAQVTPPRLGLIEGEVLFWRPGDGDWEAAQLNTPLAPGDALATRDGQLEMQIGGESFVRAGSGTQLRIQANEPDFLHLELSAGHLAVDLRNIKRSAVQVDTPNASVTLARDGYYRIDVDEEATRVIARRGGHATVTQSGGAAIAVGTGEAVEIRGRDAVQISELAAPPFDDWDRWNYDRADRYLASPRSAAVSADVYGVEELDRHGSWRYVNTYGRVWVPDVPVGWAPYTDGRWRWDPLYGWAWVDYAPWGWAPFHYGRWVYAGYWAWAPGPIIAAPVYSPALVAFFGGPGISVGIGVPFVSWVALGWGEPLYPWWGGVGFIGSPCWWGWGGPRIVNNVVINNGDVINGDINYNYYRNKDVPGALVGVPKDQFDTRSIRQARLDNIDGSKLAPVRGALPVAAKGGGLDGGRKGPDLAGARSRDGLASAQVGREMARAGAGNSFNRQRDAQGALRAGSDVSSNSRPDNSTFDSLRQRGNGSGGGAHNLARSSGDAATAGGKLSRGGSPPSANGAAKNGSTFDALRGRNGGGTANSASAALNRSGGSGQGASDMRRGQSPPSLSSSGTSSGSGKAPAFDALRRGGSSGSASGAAVRGGSKPSVGGANLNRGQSPPAVPGGSKIGSATAPLQRFKGSTRQPSASSSGSANLRRGQSASPSGSANLRRGSSAGSAGSANVRRQSPPAVPRGGTKLGSATAPLQRYSGSSSRQVSRNTQRAPQVANVRRGVESSGGSPRVGSGGGQGGGNKAPSVRSYSAPSYSRQSAPSTSGRTISRGSGTSYSRSSGGGSAPSYSRSMGGSAPSYSRSMGGGGIRSGGSMGGGGRSAGMGGGGGSRGAMGSGKLGR